MKAHHVRLCGYIMVQNMFLSSKPSCKPAVWNYKHCLFSDKLQAACIEASTFIAESHPATLNTFYKL